MEITWCTNENCEHNCLRKYGEKKEEQDYACFNPRSDGSCEYFIGAPE